MRRALLCVVVASLAIPVGVGAKPGVARWDTKTSLLPDAPKKTAALAELLSLEVPVIESEGAIQHARIAPQSSDGLHEGDLVTITGWLHLVAYKSSKSGDEDYHLQMTSSPTDGSNCVVVEAPNPEYIKDPQLAAQSTAVRQFVDEQLMNGHPPSGSGSVLTHPVFVSVTARKNGRQPDS